MKNHETLQNRKPAKFRCPDCKNKYTSLAFLLNHVKIEHGENIPQGITPKQYCFNRRNKKEFAVCVICKKNKTKWNEENGRYERFCSDACKKKAGEIAEQNLLKRTGKTRQQRMMELETQKKLLANRSISGQYKFSDGKTVLTYVGSYELDFLEFYDKEFGGNPQDLMECPITFQYEFEGNKHTYIPDFCLTLDSKYPTIIEIKDGGDNPNKHPKIIAVDKVKEKLKDEAVINSKSFNYIKIKNKEYEEFVKLVNILRERNASDDDTYGTIIVL